jgi:hypothetical protein
MGHVPRTPIRGHPRDMGAEISKSRYARDGRGGGRPRGKGVLRARWWGWLGAPRSLLFFLERASGHYAAAGPRVSSRRGIQSRPGVGLSFPRRGSAAPAFALTKEFSSAMRLSKSSEIAGLSMRALVMGHVITSTGAHRCTSS